LAVFPPPIPFCVGRRNSDREPWWWPGGYSNFPPFWLLLGQTFLRALSGRPAFQGKKRGPGSSEGSANGPSPGGKIGIFCNKLQVFRKSHRGHGPFRGARQQGFRRAGKTTEEIRGGGGKNRLGSKKGRCVWRSGGGRVPGRPPGVWYGSAKTPIRAMEKKTRKPKKARAPNPDFGAGQVLPTRPGPVGGPGQGGNPIESRRANGAKTPQSVGGGPPIAPPGGKKTLGGPRGPMGKTFFS